MTQIYSLQRIRLDPTKQSVRARQFKENLLKRVIGQERAVRQVTNLYQAQLAGLNAPHHPLGTLLFLGPTGCGKTRVVEACGEALYNNPNTIIKIDCGEFQESHEIAKLTGSPPGYLGHRETNPLLTQENLNRFHNNTDQISFLLFDEIEKASDGLWNLLLGILDHGHMSLGDNRVVNFSKSMIFMTSNLGAKEMSELIIGGMGFVGRKQIVTENLQEKIYRTALAAAEHTFSKEFMNRIDKVVVFDSLTENHLKQILELELAAIQRLVYERGQYKVGLEYEPKVKEFLLAQGTDLQYGARPLKRTLERLILFPLANIMASDQVSSGDKIFVKYVPKQEKFEFHREIGTLVLHPKNHGELY